MENCKIERTLNELCLEKNKYLDLREIKSIKLDSGREIRPDWLHNRIMFSDNVMKIIYGNPIPYGARIFNNYYFSSSYKEIYFTPSKESELLIPDCEYYSNFRQPRETDFLRASSSLTTYSDSIITGIDNSVNKIIVYLSKPIEPYSHLSFFDSSVCYSNKFFDNGKTIEGIYVIFEPNTESISKKETVHEIIKFKEITSLTLSVNNNKKFLIEGSELDGKRTSR